jgi:hypothetical protein
MSAMFPRSTGRRTRRAPRIARQWSDVSKSYAAGLENHCPGGACFKLGLKSPQYQLVSKINAGFDHGPVKRVGFLIWRPAGDPGG